MVKLNLGCGDKYLKGYINTDNNKSIKADKYFDLNSLPYPFKDNFADVILMDNVLEHLDDIISIMNELHRVVKPTGLIEIYLPYGKSDGALQDPTHKHYFTERSMNYFEIGNPYGYYTKKKFKILQKKLFSVNSTKLSKFRLIIPFKPILKYFFFNIYDALYFKLQAIK